MPDEVQQAQDNMRQWMDTYKPTPPPASGFAGIGTTIAGMAKSLQASTAAGQFALSEDTVTEIINQLTKVQDEARTIRATVFRAALPTPLGDGYAKQVGAFNEQLASGGENSADDLLSKFVDQLDELKNAVSQSIGNYLGTDQESAGGMNAVGGQL